MIEIEQLKIIKYFFPFIGATKFSEIYHSDQLKKIKRKVLECVFFSSIIELLLVDVGIFTEPNFLYIVFQT